GKTVRINDKTDCQVTGVLKDLARNSTLQFEWLRPWNNFESSRDYLKSWNNFGVATYVELTPKADVTAIGKKLWNYLEGYSDNNNSHLSLLAMTDWRLYDGFRNGQPTGEGRITYVRMFSIIALIIIVIACINFMNLATARSNRQSKEVGVRKVLGAGKGSLVGRFMGESLLVSVMATLIAILFTVICLPAFNGLTGKELEFGTPLHLGVFAAIAVVCGLLAGSYPSLYLSSFKPISVLKGGKSKTGRATVVRKGLVVTQFSVSIALIICTIIILQQVNHVKKRNLGFDKNNLIEIDVRGDVAKHFQSVQQELIATGVVENASLADHATIEGGNNSRGFSWDGKEPGKDVRISYRIGTADFFPTLGMKIKEGRGFNANGAGDSLSVVITDNLAKLMGNGSAVGKIIDARDFGYEKVKVVGVVNDFVYGNAFSQQSDPVIFFCLPGYADQFLYVRPKAGTDLQTALSKIEKVIAKAAPAYPFTYRFVDDQFNKFFFNEVLIGKIARIFAGLAILISCLGLFGLAAYTAEQRTREIGIRKVMGASVSGIAALLSKDFLKLVLLAAVVAFPLAWFFMDNWLQDYAYRVSIQWWVFIAAASAAVVIAVATISSHAIRAALVNPVKSLRTE
ncbi:FtsX-like permease family protein, partial [uncultured Chitinophaga sp.]|uniref:FtsX-like permease family protein n=1 Tax=uncultured Chitinophaga sp. TaxID=339340 RepID=UPI0025D3B0D5